MTSKEKTEYLPRAVGNGGGSPPAPCLPQLLIDHLTLLPSGGTDYAPLPPDFSDLPTALLPISAVVTPLWISKEHENNEAFIERVQFC